MDWWSNQSLLARLSTWLPYAAVLVGAAVAIVGIYLKSIVDRRIDRLDQQEIAERKATAPAIEVTFAISEASGQPVLVLQFANDIPVEANWHVQTRNNRLVSGWQTEKAEIVPADDRRKFVYRVPINADKVLDDYVELVFRYASVYSAELNEPSHLRGEIVKKYRYTQGRLYHWRE